MEIQIAVCKVEIKDPGHYELQCQLETEDTGLNRINTRSSIILDSPQTLPIKWPNFNFQVKQQISAAAFRFTVFHLNSSMSDDAKPIPGLKPKETGVCLFPISFHPPSSRDLKFLATDMSKAPKKIHQIYLTSQVDGSDLQKVVGKVWFKIINSSPTSKQLLSSRVSWMNLISVQRHVTKIDTLPVSSMAELVEKELQLSMAGCFLSVKSKVSVVFHQVNSYTDGSDMIPIACIGMNPSLQKKTLFTQPDGASRLSALSILKPVSLVCKDNEQCLELHLASNSSVIFSAAHSVKKLIPFKQYNWQYTWRWISGIEKLRSLHTLAGCQEPNLTVSIVYHPSRLQYAKYEGLEVLVCGIELGSSVRDKNVVLCVQSTKLTYQNRSHRATNLKKEFDINSNLSVVKFGEFISQEIRPAYFFYPTGSFFQSKEHGICLKLQLYATGYKQQRPWWEASSVSSSILEIPSGMLSIIRKSEYRDGIYWELTGNDIMQSGSSNNVAHKMFGVVRWKKFEMNFLHESIVSDLFSLHTLKDIAPVQGIQPGLLTSILPSDKSKEIKTEKEYSASHYRAALSDMGSDISRLREEIQTLKRYNQQLDHCLKKLESVVYSASNQASLQELTKADLIRKIHELSAHLNSEIQAREKDELKISTSQKDLIAKNKVESRLLELQEAHIAQQMLVRNLQIKLEKYRKCADTCRQQEDLIHQFDSLLTNKADDVRAKDTISLLSRENAKLKKSLSKLKQRSSSSHLNHNQEKGVLALRADNSKLKAKCESLTSQLKESRRKHNYKFHEQTRTFETTPKLKLATARGSTLYKELEDARICALDNAKQRVEIAKYQAEIQALREELVKTRVKSEIRLSYPSMLSSPVQGNEGSCSQSLTSQMELEPYWGSQHFQVREHPQSLGDSLDPRLSF